MKRAKREYMERAVQLAGKCVSEGGRVRPKVGCLVVVGDQTIAEGYRGEFNEGDHAEYSVLSKKLEGRLIQDAVLYTTLEPCTSRIPPKKPCCERIIEAGIKSVVIGIVDPNEAIRGHGYWALRRKSIDIEWFDPDLTHAIEVLNKDFIESHLASSGTGYSPHFLKPEQRRLDDWYSTINSIYLDKNFYRSPESIFAHLVEVLGGLSLLATGKSKVGVHPEKFVTKALAWWLALCGKVGVRSVEDLIWRKFPRVCPYCRCSPHDARRCKQMKAMSKNPDWVRLLEQGKNNEHPASLCDWQNMFQEIYPAGDTDTYDNIFGRFTEELGELSEAVRVVDLVPEYFISEASDVFAWLMKLANVVSYKSIGSTQPFSLEAELFTSYPDRCNECSRRICACPPVLPTTLGRLAHEGPDPETGAEPLFITNRGIMSRFDIGAIRVNVGDTELVVDSSLISEVYNFSTRLLNELRLISNRDNTITPQLMAALQNIAGLAAVQRISQLAVDEFLRLTLSLGGSSKENFRDVIRNIQGERWLTAILRFCKQAAGD